MNRSGPISKPLDFHRAMSLLDGLPFAYFVTKSGQPLCLDYVNGFTDDLDACLAAINAADPIVGWRLNDTDFNLHCSITGVRIPSQWGIIE